MLMPRTKMTCLVCAGRAGVYYMPTGVRYIFTGGVLDAHGRDRGLTMHSIGKDYSPDWVHGGDSLQSGGLPPWLTDSNHIPSTIAWRRPSKYQHHSRISIMPPILPSPNPGSEVAATSASQYCKKWPSLTDPPRLWSGEKWTTQIDCQAEVAVARSRNMGLLWKVGFCPRGVSVGVDGRVRERKNAGTALANANPQENQG